jgi:hypothetical protein
VAPRAARSSTKTSDPGKSGGGPRSAPCSVAVAQPPEPSSLLGLEVRYRGLVLGFVRDVFIDPDDERVLGLEIEGAGEQRFFLPAATWVASTGAVEAARPLAFLSEVELRFYERRARRVSEVQKGGRAGAGLRRTLG